MDVRQLQGWLAEHGQSIAADGLGGPRTRAAILAAFVNLEAPAVDESDIAGFAARLGCTPRQVRAIAQVESSGGGFTAEGRPKILFERHYFWRLTEGRHGFSAWSNPKRGGYSAMDSWLKLAFAACQDPEAAFASASWGKFQVMGAHAARLDYRSALAMAWTMTRSEADHYEAMVRYILAFGLVEEARALSTDPEANRAFAKGYNGPAYEDGGYHLKLARAMR
jgi:hypothetical protein